VLAAVALASVWSPLTGPITWTPDGLFYQEHVLRIRGVPDEQAFRSVFEGPLSAGVRESWGDERFVEWVEYNDELGFYERRLAVPLVAAAIEPAAGERSLLVVSVAGFVAAVLVLFALLRLHFSLAIAFATTLLAILLPPFRHFSALPLTDSWGVALLVAGLLCALLTLRRGTFWLLPFAAALLVLGFTRDSGWVLVLGTLGLAVTTRERRALLLTGVGACAVMIAPLLHGLPLREVLAFTLNDFRPPPETSWSFLARHYPDGVLELVRADAGFLRRGEWFTAVYMIGGIVALFALGRESTDRVAATLMQATAVASLLYLLALPNFTGFRLELVFLPAAAFGVALLLARLELALRRRAPSPQLGSAG
jgi:hypothetical protein